MALLVDQAMTTPFDLTYEYRLEIEGGPDDINLYVKNWTRSGFQINWKPIKLGVGRQLVPESIDNEGIALTLRDKSGVWLQYFKDQYKKVAPGGGCVGLPVDYIMNVKRYPLIPIASSADYTEGEPEEFVLVPGEVTGIEHSGESEFSYFTVVLPCWRVI